jgi:histidinol-phosphate aminotransferase
MKIARRFQNFPPYTPIEPFEVLSARLGRDPQDIIKLDANENPYGPSPLVKKALADMAFPHIYPDPESRQLREGLSKFTGVPCEYLMAGSGADELIDLVARVFIEPGDVVLNCPPTFGMYSFDTLLNAGNLVEIVRNPDFSLDLSAIRDAVERFKPKILFLTTPNNPDGNFPSESEISQLLDLSLLIVIDEAYIEFADSSGELGYTMSRMKQVPKRENLVVLRTFSKWAGLAGLRVGYGAFPAWLMPTLWKTKQPYNVNVAASTAALASFEDLPYLADNVRKIQAERERLYQKLKEIPFLMAYPSKANFILCQVLDRPGAELKNNLVKNGVLVRHYNTPLLNNYIRISVGKPTNSDVLIAALKAMV